MAGLEVVVFNESSTSHSSSVALPTPHSRDRFSLELADNWEYSGLRINTDALADVRNQVKLKADFWHEVQVRAARCVSIQMEIEDNEEEGSLGVTFKIRDYFLKRGKMTHNVAATTKLIARRDTHSSYWLHIVDPELAGRLGVTLLTMKKVCEAVFGTVLVRLPANAMPKGKMQEMIRKAREEVRNQIKLEPEEEVEAAPVLQRESNVSEPREDYDGPPPDLKAYNMDIKLEVD